MTHDNELRNCPFCGSNDIDPEGVASFKPPFIFDENLKWENAEPHMIENRPACNECGATTNGDWNTRTPPPPSGDAVRLALDVLEEAADEYWDDHHSHMSEGDFENHWLIMKIRTAQKKLRALPATPVNPPVTPEEAAEALRDMDNHHSSGGKIISYYLDDKTASIIRRLLENAKGGV